MFRSVSIVVIMVAAIITVSTYYSRSGQKKKISAIHRIEKVADGIRLIRNRESILPLKRLDTLNIGCYSDSMLFATMKLYAQVERLGEKEDKNFNLKVVVASSLDELMVLKEQSGKAKLVVVTSCALGYEVPDIADVVLTVEELNEDAMRLIPQVIFGARGIDKGQYPFKAIGRLGYTLPEAHGINHCVLEHSIDSLANLGIDSAAYPGCQILVAKGGDVIFHKTYGYITYDKKNMVTKNLLYDWASITKITGPLPLLMKLEEEDQIDLDKPFASYWKPFRNSNKSEITLREILAHQSGMPAWLSYWKETRRKSGKFKNRYVRDKRWRKIAEQFSDSLWVNHRFHNQVYKDIAECPLLEKKEYKYSGLSFFLFPDLITNLMDEDYEQALKKYFTIPLGAYSVVFNPLKHGFKKSDIVPTEYDSIFRKQLIHGWVHDEGAAIMGGISGNSGLFGTTNDLAKMMQLFLQMGTYGDHVYLKKRTIKKFTRVQYPENENRRGLGFDKPYIDNKEKELKDAYPAVSASKNSFGHSGFTGTFAWADPDEDLIFIFMSNRVYPSRDNSKLYDLNLRPQMHQAIYDCLNTYTRKSNE